MMDIVGPSPDALNDDSSAESWSSHHPPIGVESSAIKSVASGLIRKKIRELNLGNKEHESKRKYGIGDESTKHRKSKTHVPLTTQEYHGSNPFRKSSYSDDEYPAGVRHLNGEAPLKWKMSHSESALYDKIHAAPFAKLAKMEKVLSDGRHVISKEGLQKVREIVERQLQRERQMAFQDAVTQTSDLDMAPSLPHQEEPPLIFQERAPPKRKVAVVSAFSDSYPGFSKASRCRSAIWVYPYSKENTCYKQKEIKLSAEIKRTERPVRKMARVVTDTDFVSPGHWRIEKEAVTRIIKSMFANYRPAGPLRKENSFSSSNQGRTQSFDDSSNSSSSSDADADYREPEDVKESKATISNSNHNIQMHTNIRSFQAAIDELKPKKVERVRHYDQAAVQQYILKQRAERRRKQLEEKRKQEALRQRAEFVKQYMHAVRLANKAADKKIIDKKAGNQLHKVDSSFNSSPSDKGPDLGTSSQDGSHLPNLRDSGFAIHLSKAELVPKETGISLHLTEAEASKAPKSTSSINVALSHASATDRLDASGTSHAATKRKLEGYVPDNLLEKVQKEDDDNISNHDLKFNDATKQPASAITNSLLNISEEAGSSNLLDTEVSEKLSSVQSAFVLDKNITTRSKDEENGNSLCINESSLMNLLYPSKEKHVIESSGNDLPNISLFNHSSFDFQATGDTEELINKQQPLTRDEELDKASSYIEKFKINESSLLESDASEELTGELIATKNAAGGDAVDHMHDAEGGSDGVKEDKEPHEAEVKSKMTEEMDLEPTSNSTDPESVEENILTEGEGMANNSVPDEEKEEHNEKTDTLDLISQEGKMDDAVNEEKLETKANENEEEQKQIKMWENLMDGEKIQTMDSFLSNKSSFFTKVDQSISALTSDFHITLENEVIMKSLDDEDEAIHNEVVKAVSSLFESTIDEGVEVPNLDVVSKSVLSVDLEEDTLYEMSPPPHPFWPPHTITHRINSICSTSNATKEKSPLYSKESGKLRPQDMMVLTAISDDAEMANDLESSSNTPVPSSPPLLLPSFTSKQEETVISNALKNFPNVNDVEGEDIPGLPGSYDRHQLQIFLNKVAHILFDGYQLGIPFNEIVPSDDILTVHSVLKNAPAEQQRYHNHFLFDLCKNVCNELFGVKQLKSTFPRKSSQFVVKPLVPQNINQFCNSMKQKVISFLVPSSTCPAPWDEMEGLTDVLKKKKGDKLDKILYRELKEEEPEWRNFDQEEEIVKESLVHSVFDFLLEDTVKALQNISVKQMDV